MLAKCVAPSLEVAPLASKVYIGLGKSNLYHSTKEKESSGDGGLRLQGNETVEPMTALISGYSIIWKKNTLLHWILLLL